LHNFTFYESLYREPFLLCGHLKYRKPIRMYVFYVREPIGCRQFNVIIISLCRIRSFVFDTVKSIVEIPTTIIVCRYTVTRVTADIPVIVVVVVVVVVVVPMVVEVVVVVVETVYCYTLLSLAERTKTSITTIAFDRPFARHRPVW